ncbi:MAG TPA: hypothetical protein VL333_03685 [Candidatus Saccharimonadales bacterium]|jgi:hypothetical protein|nr:hypothetical protein [Candidatus Saccharimonadales bacterium]
MEIGGLLVTVVLLALVLATVAGFVAARLMMHAATARPTQDTNER